MLFEVVVMSMALVFATRQSLFDDKLKTVLFYGAIAAAASIVGNTMRGHASSAWVSAPIAFALMAAGIHLTDCFGRRKSRRR